MGCVFCNYGECNCADFTDEELENFVCCDESCPHFSDNSWEVYKDWIRDEDAKIRFFEKG